MGETGLPEPTLYIREPWTMPCFEVVDIFIDALHKRIGPKHVLYRRDVFPEILEDYRLLEEDDIPAALEYAAAQTGHAILIAA